MPDCASSVGDTARAVTIWMVVAATTLAGCATVPPAAACPEGTRLARHVYSGGGEAEWCRRPDGARQGPETRFYENGVQLVNGEYRDGALDGVWRYRFNDGRNWRADRWSDGALIEKTVDPAVARMSEAELAAKGPMTSGVIKLAAHDALTGREAAEEGGTAFVGHYPNGQPRAAGRYDADGLRTGVWRFWYEDGHPAREIEFIAGVRERTAREWHPNGQLASEGSYVAGEREGRWRWWDVQGRPTRETSYGAQ